MIAISLFDYTGNMLKPWLEAGYTCHLFDIQHETTNYKRDDGMWCHKVDLRTTPDYFEEWTRDNIAFMSCFPPCTHLAISGARWFKGKGLRALEESIAYFATCAEIAEKLHCPFFIENPMSTISTYWREPDYKFNPSDYSDYVGGQEDYQKETWIWAGNGFVMPPKRRGGDLFSMPDSTYIHHQPPGEERANIRSATPMGFAKAAFEANHSASQMYRKRLVEKANDLKGIQ